MEIRPGGSRWSRLPFNPASSPVPYAWVVALAGTIGIVVSAPGQTIGVSAFTDPLLEALSLGRVQLSTAYMIGTIGSGLLLPLAGALYDRFGARALVPLDSLLLGAVLLLLSRCDRLIAWVQAAWPGAGSVTVAVAVMSALFLVLRLSGQGMMTLFSRNMVMEWFDRKRGRVAALQGAVVGACFAFAPKGFDLLIARGGWRWAWEVLALAVGFGFTLFSVVVYRRSAESCGLPPDGGLPARSDAPGNADAEPAEPEPVAPRSFRAREALASRTFWIFNLGTSLFSLYLTAFTFHIVDIFAEAGLDRDAAIAFFPVSTVLTIVGGVLVSRVADRVEPRWLLAVELLGMGLLAGGTLFLGAWPWTARAVMILGYALAGATFGTLVAVVWPRLFGRAYLGRISGVNMSSLVFASAVGPYLFATSREATDSYALAIRIGLGAVALLFAASFAATPPRPLAD